MIIESSDKLEGAKQTEASERVKLPWLLDPPFSCHWKVPSDDEVKDRVVDSPKFVVKVLKLPLGLQGQLISEASLDWKLLS